MTTTILNEDANAYKADDVSSMNDEMMTTTFLCEWIVYLG